MVLRGEAQLELGQNCQHVGLRREGFPNPSFLLLASNLLNLPAACYVSLTLRPSFLYSLGRDLLGSKF